MNSSNICYIQLYWKSFKLTKVSQWQTWYTRYTQTIVIITKSKQQCLANTVLIEYTSFAAFSANSFSKRSLSCSFIFSLSILSGKNSIISIFLIHLQNAFNDKIMASASWRIFKCHSFSKPLFYLNTYTYIIIETNRSSYLFITISLKIG